MSNNDRKCESHDDNFDNCLFPDAISIRKTKGFKDEPLEDTKYCPYKLWIGPASIALSNFTRSEWEVFSKKCTLCTYK